MREAVSVNQRSAEEGGETQYYLYVRKKRQIQNLKSSEDQKISKLIKKRAP